MNAYPENNPLTPVGVTKETTRLERYLHFLGRKWWVVVLCAGLCAAGQFLYLIDEPAAYDSYARLMMGGKVKLPDNLSFSEDYLNYFGTQIELLQSEKIHNRALERMKVEHPDIKEAPIKVQANQLRRTSIILLRASGPDPAFTRSFLDAVVDEYLSFKREMRTVASDDTLASLTAKLLEQEKTLKTEQEKMYAFKRENNVALLQEVNVAAGTYLARLKTQLAELRTEEAVISLLSVEESLPQHVTTPDSKALNNSTQNPNLPADYFGAKQQLQLLKFQRDDLGQYMRPEHPRIVKLNEDIARLEKLLDIYRDQGQQQRSLSLESIRLRIKAVEDTLSDWEKRVVDANSRMSDYDKLKDTVARAQALYDQMLRLLQNVDVNKNIDQENMTIMERATVAAEQIRLPLRLAVAGGVGFFLGLGILVLWERRDDRLFSLIEFKQQFEESLICQIPQVRAQSGKNQPVLITGMETHSMFAEGFRHLHSSLVLGPQLRSILVTSTFSTEGKSTVAVNLALTAALSGARVLLIDADIYHGKLHKWLGVEASPGLSEVHQGKSSAAKSVSATGVENLFLMAAGSREAASSLLLNATTLEELSRLYRDYDLVIIDSAPIFAGDDALRLGQSVDGVLLVVRSGVSRAGAITRSLEQLYQRRAKVLGFVLNGVDANVDDCHRYRESEYRKLSAVK